MVNAAKKREQNRLRQARWRQRQREAKAPLISEAASTSVDVFNWCESELVVPEGRLAGRPFRIGDWQRSFWQEAMAPGIMEAGLTVARKNGKSGLIAALVLAHLIGPLNRPGWKCAVTSMTGALAQELRHAIVGIAKASNVKVVEYKSPTPGAVLGAKGSEVRFLAADRATGHAIGSDLAIIDEAGLMQENQRALWNAMLTSISGRDGRMLTISILGDGPMFKELRARRGSAGVVWHEYVTTGKEKIDDPAVWAKANPGLADGIKSMAYMKTAVARAKANPADASLFRAYDLNAPQAPDRLMLLTAEQWDGCRGSAERDGWCTVGIDLGGSSSMTAAAAYWPKSGLLFVKAALPGVPDIYERERIDGVGNRYQRMVERGELTVYPGVKTTPVSLFLRDFFDELQGQDIRAVTADRFRQSEGEDVYDNVGLSARRSWRGQGWKDASDDVREFQKAAIDGRMHACDSLVLESAIVESALAIDPAGNQKLDKARATGRIDAASASVLAVGEAMREEILERQGGFRYFGKVQSAS